MVSFTSIESNRTRACPALKPLLVRACVFICYVLLWLEVGVCAEHPQVRGRVVRVFLGHDSDLGLSGNVRNAGRRAG